MIETEGEKTEERARRKIVRLLEDAGRAVQGRGDYGSRASRGIAVREYPIDTGSADYLLFVDRQVIEAKESQKYRPGYPESNLHHSPTRAPGRRRTSETCATPTPNPDESSHSTRPEILGTSVETSCFDAPSMSWRPVRREAHQRPIF